VEAVAGILALLGAAFVLLAGVGTLRFPDALSRMHAATKAPALGFALIVVGAEFQVTGGSAKLAIAVGLVFLTAPVAAHLVGRSVYRSGAGPIRLDDVDQLAEAEAEGEGEGPAGGSVEGPPPGGRRPHRPASS
jgi:multicomponent Na+:H+ antiporter subunit G